MRPNGQTDHDLWGTLFRLFITARNKGLIKHVIKVTSHQNLAEFSQTVEVWAIRGNSEADRLAVEARQHFTATLRNAWEAHANSVKLRKAACVAMHTLMVQLGSKAMQDKDAQQDKQVGEWEGEARRQQQTPEQEPSIGILPAHVEEPVDHTMGQCFHSILRWLRNLQTGDGLQSIWLSSYQLYAHFQAFTGEWGFKYVQRKWIPADDSIQQEDFDFIRLSASFLALVKCFAVTLGLPYATNSNIPFGSVFRSWQRCVLLTVPIQQFRDVNELFHARGARSVKVVHTSLRQYADFRACCQ